MKQSLKDPGINLVLGGGGARGAFHLGVLQFLDENNIKVAAISGSSIGALIGASYASGITPKQQLAIFKSKDFNSIYRSNLFGGSLFQIDTDAAILGALLPKKVFEDLQIPLFITAFNISQNKRVCFTQGNLLAPLVATTALPIFFAPQKIKDSYYVDGGMIDNLPAYAFTTKRFTLVCDLNPDLPSRFSHSFVANIKRTFRQMWLYASKKEGIESADMLLSVPALNSYSIIKRKNLDTLFELGYKECEKSFKS